MYIMGGGMIGAGALGYVIPPRTKQKPTHIQQKEPAETTRR
jgi:hypothetical protein